MATRTFRPSYPMTPEGRTALARFPEIAKAVQIPPAGRSDLEIVRLLGNTHYAHLDRLLAFIEGELPGSAMIGSRAVKQRDPFQFREALAELFLFAHLRRRLGSQVQPAVFPKGAVGPEIEIMRPEFTVKIEVYSPLDLMGYQLITEHLPMLFKYLDVDRGFTVEVAIYPVNNSVENVWYPHTLPDREEVLAWLKGVGRSAQALLSRRSVSPGEHVRLAGPGGTTRLRIRVLEIHDDRENRGVFFTTGTCSTDARLLFEVGSAADTARSGWGQKLKTKMRGRQAGPPAPGLLRVLVVNFAQADTGWPDFFTWPEIAQRLDETVRLIVRQLISGLPYDLVLPARLDIDCDFGVPIWLDPSFQGLAGRFMQAAGIESKPRPRPKTQTVPSEQELAEPLEEQRTCMEEVTQSVSDARPRNQAAIDGFTQYFANQLRLIGALESHHYRKTLFVAVLDTLSRAAVPHLKDKNRERFLGFVEGWADWPEAGRVSLPQLAGNLLGHAELAKTRLASEVRRRLHEWKDGHVYHASDDPPKEELLEFAANAEERKVVEGHTHLNLLWVYRNTLVHEFREPGYDMGVLGDDPSPYYMTMEDEEGVSQWELAYPTTFFAALCDRALANLKKHLEVEDLDPYGFYEFGSIWKRVTLRQR